MSVWDVDREGETTWICDGCGTYETMKLVRALTFSAAWEKLKKLGWRARSSKDPATKKQIWVHFCPSC